MIEFGSMRFYEKSDLLKPRICNRCDTINAPTSSWCSQCGFPLTWDEFVKYEEQRRERQYIKDLQFLDRYYPELDPPKKTSRRRRLSKQKVVRCYMCLNLSETVVDGEIVDYYPHCGAPFSEKTILREHWIETHPEEAKAELKEKLEMLNGLLREKLKGNNLSTKEKAISRQEVIDALASDPSILLDTLKEIKSQKLLDNY